MNADALPEMLIRAGNFALLRRVLANGPASDASDIERYVEALAQPLALAASLNYYRAAARFPRPPCARFATPTLVLWSDRDPYLRPTLATGPEPWVNNLRVQGFPEADHWLHHREASAANERLVEFLRG